MLFTPEVKNIDSYDLDFGSEPVTPSDCKIRISVAIGLRNQNSSDLFRFIAITHRAVLRETDYHWGRGWLIVDNFTWRKVEMALGKLCAGTSGETWLDIARELDKWIEWEFAYKL